MDASHNHLDEVFRELLGDLPAVLDICAQHFPECAARSHEVYPDVAYPDEAFARDVARHLREHVADGADVAEAAEAWLANLIAEDLYLANACVAGAQGAMQRFEDVYGGQMTGLARRYEGPRLKTPDLRQVLLAKLFVGDADKDAKALSYTGQGALRSWLKITAVRTFIDATRSVSTRSKAEELTDGEYFDRIVDEAHDLELDFLKARYRTVFKSAFQKAVHALEPRERNLLGQSMVADLSIDQLGSMYGVHRSTAARWLNAARDSLVTNTRETMMAELDVEVDELDSIMNLIQSRASLSISRLFRPAISEDAARTES